MEIDSFAQNKRRQKSSEEESEEEKKEERECERSGATKIRVANPLKREKLSLSLSLFFDYSPKEDEMTKKMPRTPSVCVCVRVWERSRVDVERDDKLNQSGDEDAFLNILGQIRQKKKTKKNSFFIVTERPKRHFRSIVELIARSDALFGAID